MATGVSVEKIKEVVGRMEHPEIAATFQELGMVGNVREAGDGIIIEVRVPFPNIPIKDYLAGMIRREVAKIAEEIPLSFDFTVMPDEVRSQFLLLARSRWKGEI